MTLTLPTLPTAPTLRHWLRSLCQQLAPAAAPQRRSPWREAPAAPPIAADTATGTATAAAPTWPGRVGLEACRVQSASATSPEDWDQLFSAVLDRLSQQAPRAPAQLGDVAGRPRPAATVGECLAALDRLRRLAPTVWGSRLTAVVPQDE